MMKIFRNIIYYIIFIFLILFYSDTYSQLLEKKEFRLKNKPEILKFDFKNQFTAKPISLQKTKKSMLLAGALSFIVPGAAIGQFYKEEFINGGIRLGISVLCIICFLVSPEIDFGGGGDGAEKIIAAGIYGVNWIVSIIDALIPSKNNSYSKYRKYRLSY